MQCHISLVTQYVEQSQMMLKQAQHIPEVTADKIDDDVDVYRRTQSSCGTKPRLHLSQQCRYCPTDNRPAAVRTYSGHEPICKQCIRDQTKPMSMTVDDSCPECETESLSRHGASVQVSDDAVSNIEMQWLGCDNCNWDNVNRSSD